MTHHHVWTPEQDALLDRVAAGELTITRAAVILGLSYDSVRYRMVRRGLIDPTPRKAKVRPLPPPATITAADGWVPIARRGKFEWQPLPDAPMPISVAHAMADEGRAFLAQRRVEGTFDLVVRMRA